MWMDTYKNLTISMGASCLGALRGPLFGRASHPSLPMAALSLSLMVEHLKVLSFHSRACLRILVVEREIPHHMNSE